MKQFVFGCVVTFSVLVLLENFGLSLTYRALLWLHNSGFFEHGWFG